MRIEFVIGNTRYSCKWYDIIDGWLVSQGKKIKEIKTYELRSY